MDGLAAADVDTAAKVLSEHGYSCATALKLIKEVRAFGAIMDIERNAPSEFHDPNHPCFFAVRILALTKLVSQSEPTALQVGRIWGRLGQGLHLPEISKAIRQGHLAKHRGRGGSEANDLTRTIEAVLREHPDLDGAGLVVYLRSEEALDRFNSVEARTIFVTNVEIKNGSVVYEDQRRVDRKVKLATLDRKIRSVRKKAKG